MKKICSIIMLALLASPVFAQDSYFIKAGSGAGISSPSYKVFYAEIYTNHLAAPSGQLELCFGMSHGNLQFETGMKYLLTGMQIADLVTLYGDPVFTTGSTISSLTYTEQIKFTVKNSHLVLPFIVSYNLNKNKKISFDPGIGIEAAYNFQSVVINQTNTQDYKTDFKCNAISAMILLKFDVAYRLNKQLSVWCSPSLQYMVTSLNHKEEGYAMSRRYDHAMLFSVGIKYDLHCLMGENMNNVNN